MLPQLVFCSCQPFPSHSVWPTHNIQFIHIPTEICRCVSSRYITLRVATTFRVPLRARRRHSSVAHFPVACKWSVCECLPACVCVCVEWNYRFSTSHLPLPTGPHWPGMSRPNRTAQAFAPTQSRTRRNATLAPFRMFPHGCHGMSVGVFVCVCVHLRRVRAEYLCVWLDA